MYLDQNKLPGITTNFFPFLLTMHKIFRLISWGLLWWEDFESTDTASQPPKPFKLKCVRNCSMMIPFNKPYMCGKELQYIHDAVKRGKIRWITHIHLLFGHGMCGNSWEDSWTYGLRQTRSFCWERSILNRRFKSSKELISLNGVAFMRKMRRE